MRFWNNLQKVSEWLLFNANSAIVSAISWRDNFQWDDDEVRFVLDKHDELDCIVLAHWNNSHVALLGDIILILSQPVFAIFP